MSIDVLIAEDEPGIMESLDFIFKRAGWSIHAVTDGDAVLASIKSTSPKVVVLDIMLPKISGFEVLQQIRSDEQTRHVPVLILTAKGQQQDKRTAEELGADAFVTKPYANAEVVDTVRALMEGGAT